MAAALTEAPPGQFDVRQLGIIISPCVLSTTDDFHLRRMSRSKAPFGVTGRTSVVNSTTDLMLRSTMIGVTSIPKRVTNIKLHAQSSMERKVRKVHF